MSFHTPLLSSSKRNDKAKHTVFKFRKLLDEEDNFDAFLDYLGLDLNGFILKTLHEGEQDPLSEPKSSEEVDNSLKEKLGYLFNPLVRSDIYNAKHRPYIPHRLTEADFYATESPFEDEEEDEEEEEEEEE